jgi:hypothetical protein
MANSTQGLEDLEVQLVLHMTGKVAGRGSTIRLLRIADPRVANFYGVGGEKYKAPPGMKLGICTGTGNPHGSRVRVPCGYGYGLEF